MASIVSSVLDSAVASSLLFSTHGSSGSFKRNRDKGSYTIKLDGLSDRITWFTDLPERKAGSADIKQFIKSWSSEYFPDGVNPNAALEFTDKNGESDVVVFEMNRPIYSAKRDTLKFRAKINDGQVLDGSLESHSVLADDSFTKKFSESSLFIDNALLKDTQLTIKNNLTENVLLRPITFDKDGKTVGNYIFDALGGLVGFVGGVTELALGLATPGTVVGPIGAAAWLGQAAAIESEIGALAVVGAAFLVDVAIGVAIVDAIQAKYHTVVDDSLAPQVIKAGESFTIQDSESRWGFHNGVADIAFLVTTEPKTDPVTGTKSGSIIGSVFFDNPTLGSTYAKIVPMTGNGLPPVPENLNTIDRITLGERESQRTDFKGGYMETKYAGDTGFAMYGTKNWELGLFAT